MPPESEQKIRLKAMCLFVHNDKVLVSEKHLDKAKNEYFHRALGGTMNFFESGEEGVRREIREELKSEIKNLRLLGISENRFIYNGQRGHEIVFLYSGDLTRKELYGKEKIHIVEDTYEFNAEWLPINAILNNEVILYHALDYGKFLSHHRVADAVTVAADIHKTILENERVRVLDVVVPPGAHAKLHSHPDNVIITMMGGKLKMTYQDGSSKEVTLVTGAVSYSPANVHEVASIDDHEIRVIQIELK